MQDKVGRCARPSFYEAKQMTGLTAQGGPRGGIDGRVAEEKDHKIGKSSPQGQTERSGADEFLTSNQGVRINDNQNSLKAGDRGASFARRLPAREKITHFDHERIPERVVHARGSPMATFKSTSPAPDTLKRSSARILLRTPVFVRFSTVPGFAARRTWPHWRVRQRKRQQDDRHLIVASGTQDIYTSTRDSAAALSVADQVLVWASCVSAALI